MLYTVNFTRGAFWANIHLGTAIICACLPVYRPLVSRFADFAANLSNRIGSLLRSSTTFKSSQTGGERPMGSITKALNRYGRLDDVGGDRSRLQTAITADAFRGGSVQRLGHGEHNRITVENTVEMV